MTFFDLRQIYDHLDRIHRRVIESSEPRWRDFSHEFNRMEKLLMALDQNVQELINQVANNNSLVASAIAALKVESDQITDLSNQVTALQAQIDAGKDPIDAEDLAALKTQVDALKETNTKLQAAVPASTPGV